MKESRIKPSFKAHQAQCCKEVLLRQWSCLRPRDGGDRFSPIAPFQKICIHFNKCSFTDHRSITYTFRKALVRLLEQPHSTGHYSLCKQSALSKSWHFSWHLTPHSPQRIPCRAIPHSSPSHS